MYVFTRRALRLDIVAALACWFSNSLVDAQTPPQRQTPDSHVTVTQCNPHRHLPGTAPHPWIDPYGVYHGAENFPYADGFLQITYTGLDPFSRTRS